MSEIENTVLLEADYLIVGAGAVGMAFADVILAESDFSIVMVDRMEKPGGHWNLAYPFVKLHQPSAFYGVSSTDLGNEDLDRVGFNKGFRHLASGSEILAYYENIMQSKFLPSGRLKYFPLCDYKGANGFVSNLSGKNYKVKIGGSWSMPPTCRPKYHRRMCPISVFRVRYHLCRSMTCRELRSRPRKLL